MEIKDNNPGTPKNVMIVNVNIFMGINIFNDEIITFNPYNKTKANITFFTTFFIISNIISILIKYYV